MKILVLCVEMLLLDAQSVKKRLAEVLNQMLGPIRENRKILEEKPGYIHEILQYGGEIAKSEGAKTLEKVKEAMSIKYF